MIHWQAIEPAVGRILDLLADGAGPAGEAVGLEREMGGSHSSLLVRGDGPFV
jgi:hypothetical protein